MVVSLTRKPLIRSSPRSSGRNDYGRNGTTPPTPSHHCAGRRSSLGEVVLRQRGRSDAYYGALEALVAIKPTTRAGAAALIAHCIAEDSSRFPA